MLLQVKNISKSYGVETVLSIISMKIDPGERIGLVGVNSAGKSTLLKIIAKEIPYDSGELYVGKDTKIGYLRQNSGLNLENTIECEMRSVFSDLIEAEQELRLLELKMGEPTVMDDLEEFEKTMNRYTEKTEWFMQHGGYEYETKIRSILSGMGFGETSRETLIDHLSGGQKTRLALAKILLQQPNLLVLDEPTNHLDFATLAWLEGYLQT